MIKHFFLADFMLLLSTRLSFSLRIIAFLFLALATIDVMGQNCNCPKPSSCQPCSGGGYTSFTLKYNGLLNGVVTIYDAGGLLRATTVSQGDIIPSFLGSIPNEKFQGPTVNVFFNSLPAATFYTTCNTQYPGDVSGAFEIISMVSKGGGQVCCLPAAIDKDAPMFSNCPTDWTENLPATSCNKTVHWNEPKVTDACKYKVTSTHTPDKTLFSKGINVVTYTATDSAGNASTCTFKVTLIDVTKPEIDGGCPLVITLAADAQCQAKYTLPVKTATDNCDGTVLVKSSYTSNIFPIGSTPVTYTATDASGNTASCSFMVVVQDTISPVFQSCPTIISGTKDRSCKTIVDLPQLTVTDNCSKNIQYHSSVSDNTDFPLGETLVTYTAVDDAANSAKCVFKVVVSNAESPEIKDCPGTITRSATASEPDSVAVTWDEPNATVVCGKVREIEKSHIPGSKFPLGKTTVTYTFWDEGEKSSTCAFDVVVLASDVLFTVSNVLTPDGDGINDVWMLPNIEEFKSNTVVIIDRWGNKIYQATGYDNVRTVWNGTNNNGTIVPTGTYFYTIEVRDQGNVVLKKGFIEVIQ